MPSPHQVPAEAVEAAKRAHDGWQRAEGPYAGWTLASAMLDAAHPAILADLREKEESAIDKVVEKLEGRAAQFADLGEASRTARASGEAYSEAADLLRKARASKEGGVTAFFRVRELAQERDAAEAKYDTLCFRLEAEIEKWRADAQKYEIHSLKADAIEAILSDVERGER